MTFPPFSGVVRRLVLINVAVFFAALILGAFAPGTAEIRIFASRKNGRIFDRDTALVIVSIEGPGLKLPSSELAFMHQKMEGVLVMVTLFTDSVKPGNEV